MSIKVATSRFMLSSLRAGFYQQILRGISGFQELGHRLVKEIDIAQTYRQDNRVIEIASILGSLPLKEHQLIGQYYEAWLGQKTGKDGRSIFERVAEESRTYKTKALMSLAATEARRGNYGEEFRYFTEALKTTDNPSLIVEVSRSIAVVKAKEGFHPQSLKDLERIGPLLRYTNPLARYQYYNSCAVELCEVGRIEEARNISNIVLASPYINAYPEWRETRYDIERKGYSSRSAVFVALTSTQQNVVLLPLSEGQKTYARNPFQPPATVRSIDEWKKMPKKKNGDKKDDFALPANPTERDIFFRIMHLASQDGLSEKKLWKMLEAVERISEETEE
jgi:hypothetical protein